MNDIFVNIYTTAYFLSFVALFIIYNKRQMNKINATSYTLLYCSITALFSLLYYNVSNGIYRDYSNLTLYPYLYLFVSYIIILYPLYYNDQQIHMRISIDSHKIKFIRILIYIIIACSILPLIESLIQIPNSITDSSSMSSMYEQRLEGSGNDYLSFFGRKFFLVLWRLNNFIPFLLFYVIIKGYNKKIIVCIVLSLLTIGLHSIILGGRAKLVQNALYVIFVYFVFYPQIQKEIRIKMAKYGVVLISVVVAGIAAVSISRFSSKEGATSMNSIWEWLGLYAGEGSLNFNALAWDAKGTTSGYCTLCLPKGLIEGELISVEELWSMKSKLGIPGNIFYTFMGPFVFDYGLGGGIFVLIILTVIFMKVYKRCNAFKKLCLIGLWGKIAIIGPIFYTYGTIDDQINLFITCLIIYIL